MKHSRAPWRIAERERTMVRVIDADGWTVGAVNVEDAPTMVHAPQLRAELELASTRYQNLIEILRPLAEEDEYCETVLEQTIAADESARALLATIEQMEGE